MISPTAAKKFGKDFGNNPVGTGPFVFKEWVKGSHITVERNPNYWEAGKPYLDRIVFRDISGAVVGAQRLATGELDFVGDMSPQEILQLQGRPGIRLHPITVGRWYSLQWHMYKPPFNNAKLRQAIAHGIDRKRINDIVMDGKGALYRRPDARGPVVVQPNDQDLSVRSGEGEGAADGGRLSERLRVHAVDAADRRAAARSTSSCRSSSPRSASS